MALTLPQHYAEDDERGDDMGDAIIAWQLLSDEIASAPIIDQPYYDLSGDARDDDVNDDAMHLCNGFSELSIRAEQPLIDLVPGRPIEAQPHQAGQYGTLWRTLRSAGPAPLQRPLRISPPISSGASTGRSEFLGARNTASRGITSQRRTAPVPRIRLPSSRPDAGTEYARFPTSLSHDFVSLPVPSLQNRRRARPRMYHSRHPVYRPASSANPTDPPPPYAEHDPLLPQPSFPAENPDNGQFWRVGHGQSRRTTSFGSKRDRMRDSVVKGMGEAGKRVRELPASVRRVGEWWKVRRARSKIQYLQKHGFLSDQERLLGSDLQV